MYISVRSTNDSPDKYSEKVTIKPEILSFTENTVVFTDNTVENIDDVIFCTGMSNNYEAIESIIYFLFILPISFLLILNSDFPQRVFNSSH